MIVELTNPLEGESLVVRLSMVCLKSSGKSREARPEAEMGPGSAMVHEKRGMRMKRK
jgi:hypothetical protein